MEAEHNEAQSKRSRREIATMAEIRLFTDPYRQNILQTLRSLDRPATVKQLADLLGEPPGKLHYHVRKLVKGDILMLDHTEEINGIVAKYYTFAYDQYAVTSDQLENGGAIPPQLQNFVWTLFDDFKDNARKLMAAAQGDDEQPVNIQALNLSLSKDEYEQLNEELAAVIQSWDRKIEAQSPGDPRDRYDFILASALHFKSNLKN